MDSSCPADFAGPNFPDPWTTRKVIPVPIRIFSQLPFFKGGFEGGQII
jgi:hypothetical protein